MSVTAEILEMPETVQVEIEPSDLKKSKKKVKKKEGDEGNEKKTIQIGMYLYSTIYSSTY